MAKPASNETVLACLRVADGGPHVASRMLSCSACRLPIWVALSSAPASRTLCLQCIGKLLCETDEPVILADAAGEPIHYIHPLRRK